MADTTFFSASAKGVSITSVLGAIGTAIASFFNSLTTAITVNATAHQRLAQIDRLNAKTDAELAELGLKREDIARHVFRDLFWT